MRHASILRAPPPALLPLPNLTAEVHVCVCVPRLLSIMMRQHWGHDGPIPCTISHPWTSQPSLQPPLNRSGLQATIDARALMRVPVSS